MSFEIEYGFPSEDASQPKIKVINTITPDYGFDMPYVPSLNRSLVQRLTGRVLTLAGAKALLEEFK